MSDEAQLEQFRNRIGRGSNDYSEVVAPTPKSGEAERQRSIERAAAAIRSATGR